MHMYMHACMPVCVCVWVHLFHSVGQNGMKRNERLCCRRQKKFKLRSSSGRGRNLSRRERASKKEIQQRAQSTTSTEKDMLSEWASEQATTCPNWQGDTGARATNSAAKRNWERKSERRASERDTNRKGNEQKNTNTKMQTQSKCMQKYCVFFSTRFIHCFSLCSFLNILLIFYAFYTYPSLVRSWN